MEDSEILKTLLSENANIRSEMIVNLKYVHNCLFFYITTISIFLGIVIKSENGNLTFPFVSNPRDVSDAIGIHNSIIRFAFLINQIEVVVVIYSISVLADVLNKAAYLTEIENKINLLLGSKTIYWQSEVANKLLKNSTTRYSQYLLYGFYFASFAYLMSLTIDSIILVGIQVLEILIVLWLARLISKEQSNAAKAIDIIENLNKKMIRK